MFVSDQLRRRPHGGVRVGDARPSKGSGAIKSPALGGAAGMVNWIGRGDFELMN